MGLLDDAIRDHIELKRKHGAEADEIARLENEAFGSIRRGLDLETGHEPTASHLHLAEDPIGAHLHEEPELLDGPPRPHGDPADALPHAPEPVHLEPEDELFADEPLEPQHEAPRPHGDPVFDAPTTVYEPLHEAPHVDPDAPRLDPDAPRQPVEPAELQPTQAFDVDEVRAALDADAEAPARPSDHEDEEGDELLEETPEFLQETPEHDRLWFEQRPPRDFDF